MGAVGDWDGEEPIHTPPAMDSPRSNQRQLAGWPLGPHHTGTSPGQDRRVTRTHPPRAFLKPLLTQSNTKRRPRGSNTGAPPPPPHPPTFTPYPPDPPDS